MAVSPPLLAALCANLRKVLRDLSLLTAHSDRKALVLPTPTLQSRGGLLQ